MEIPALLKHRAIICIGPGGVGKTTCSASLALAAAKHGKRTLVCTVDPAHRLCSALGLTELPHIPRSLPPEKLKEAGLAPDFPLFAMQLDAAAAFKRSLASGRLSSKTYKSLFRNKLYRKIVKDIEGVYAYAATAQILDLLRDDQWELVVLDTPPTRQIKPILRAPRTLAGAIKSPLFRLLAAPAKFSGKMGIRLAGKRVLRDMASVSGMAFLQDIGDFVKIIGDMAESLIQDAGQVESLLVSDSTAYIIITIPTHSRITESLSLAEHLAEYNMKTMGFMVNRFHPMFPVESDVPDEQALAIQIASLCSEDLETENKSLKDECLAAAKALHQLHEQYEALVEKEAEVLQLLYRNMDPRTLLLTVPLLNHDLEFLGDLASISDSITMQLHKQSSMKPARKPARESD